MLGSDNLQLAGSESSEYGSYSDIWYIFPSIHTDNLCVQVFLSGASPIILTEATFANAGAVTGGFVSRGSNQSPDLIVSSQAGSIALVLGNSYDGRDNWSVSGSQTILENLACNFNNCTRVILAMAEGASVVDFPFSKPLFTPWAMAGVSIDSIEPVFITTTSLPSAMVAGAYSQTLQESGGTAPFVWSISANSLPGGLSLNPSTGEISGTPSTIGTYNFTVQVTDANNQIATKDLSLLINPAVNDALVNSFNLPSTVTANQTIAVEIQMKNTGTTTWDSTGDQYSLAIIGDNCVLFGNQTQLIFAVDTQVAPGGIATFSTNITAPNANRSCSVGLQMQQQNVGTFGQALWWPIQVNLPIPTTSDALVNSFSIPSAMTTNQVSAIQVEMKNTGGTTWDSANNAYTLSVIGDNCGLFNSNQIGFAPDIQVAPNGIAIFNTNITSPSIPSSCFMGLQMQQQGVGLFGQPLWLPITVNLPANDASIVSFSIPSTMTTSQTSLIQVEIKNTGSATWDSNNVAYSMAVVGDNCGLFPGPTIAMPSNTQVATNGIVTFSANITAPNVPSSCSVGLQMQQQNVGTFGPTLWWPVNVYAPLAIDTNSLVDANVDEVYSQAIHASGGRTQYTWTISVGNLSSGLSLNSLTGEISGTPTTVQTANFTVQVTDANNQIATKDLSIVVHGNTSTGSNVQVTSGTTTLTFSNVSQEGQTTVTTSSSGSQPPSGFKLGTPPTYYSISTTATFTGQVEVCLSWTQGQFNNENNLKLFHFDGTSWTNITESGYPDTVNNVICGLATSFSDFAIFEKKQVEATIDIKPGATPNTINLGSNGTVPVTIFSTPEFDATTIDPLSVTLASAPVKLKGNGTSMSSFQDVNGDGLLDLVVHVSTEALQLSETDTLANLIGYTSDNTEVIGSDTVRVVP